MKDNPKILDNLTGYLDATQGSHDDTVLDSEWVVTSGGDVRYDLTLGMVRALHAENAKMKAVLTAALKVIHPLWDTAVKNIAPLWAVLEPILEPAVESEQRTGVCKVCDGEIRYREEIAGTTGVAVTHWWEHTGTPLVAHNAAPKSEPKPKPHHGDTDTCMTCQGDIEYYEEAAGNGDVLNSWWSHHVHPEDRHDAKPVFYA